MCLCHKPQFPQPFPAKEKQQELFAANVNNFADLGNNLGH